MNFYTYKDAICTALSSSFFPSDYIRLECAKARYSRDMTLLSKLLPFGKMNSQYLPRGSFAVHHVLSLLTQRNLGEFWESWLSLAESFY